MPNDFAAVPFIMHMRMALCLKVIKQGFFFFSVLFQPTDLIGYSLHEYKHLKQAKNLYQQTVKYVFFHSFYQLHNSSFQLRGSGAMINPLSP